jgi:myo-inositol-1(or 4)-monophosphatase
MADRSYSDVLDRIQSAIHAACEIFGRFTPGDVAAEYKAGHDPVTEADRALDAVLRKNLLRSGEGWLSEETADDRSRLSCSRVWVVDPLDGTREFVAGIPEFCVSIAMVETGQPVAAGICNPATGEVFLGSVDYGITYNGAPARASQRSDLSGALVLASRSEEKRGEWKAFQNAPFHVQAMGSVAYKLARVSAGLADATFTLTPKHIWDVAGGVALVASAGGFVRTIDQQALNCAGDSILVPGMLACGPLLQRPLTEFLAAHSAATNAN